MPQGNDDDGAPLLVDEKHDALHALGLSELCWQDALLGLHCLLDGVGGGSLVARHASVHVLLLGSGPSRIPDAMPAMGRGVVHQRRAEVGGNGTTLTIA